MNLPVQTVQTENENTNAIATFDIRPADFMSALDRRENNRKALLSWIKDNLVDGVDYGRILIKGQWSKPSLWKPGAEKISAMLNLTPRFPSHLEYERAAYEGRKIYMIILKCLLETPGGFTAGEGIGARLLAKDNGDINKALKMAEKSAHINAVLRVAGLSEIFTQDLEDMAAEKNQARQPAEKAPVYELRPKQQPPAADRNPAPQPKTPEPAISENPYTKKSIRFLSQHFLFTREEKRKAAEFLQSGSYSDEKGLRFIESLKNHIRERESAPDPETRQINQMIALSNARCFNKNEQLFHRELIRTEENSVFEARRLIITLQKQIRERMPVYWAMKKILAEQINLNKDHIAKLRDQAAAIRERAARAPTASDERKETAEARKRQAEADALEGKHFPINDTGRFIAFIKELYGGRFNPKELRRYINLWENRHEIQRRKTK